MDLEIPGPALSLPGETMSPAKKSAVKIKKTASKAKPAKKPAKKTSPPKSSRAVQAPLKSKIPVFNPEVRVYPTREILFEEAAPIVMMRAREAADNRGRFLWAISGGTTPKGLFQQLTEEPVLSLMPWDKTFVFWVDERHVPLDHADSNYRMAQETLLSKVPIPKEHIFPMTKGTLPVDQAASVYENRILKFFGTETKMPQFDLVLLGMGEDGHTASLFPGVQYLNETDKWVVGYNVDNTRKERVTLTFPVLNAAHMVMALVEGEKKADRVKEVLEGPKDPPKYPIQYVRPAGPFDFLLDAAAAKKLSKKN
jgi:6-phosphogluconolactonase